MVVPLHCERQQTDSAGGWQAPKAGDDIFVIRRRGRPILVGKHRHRAHAAGESGEKFMLR